MKPTNNTNQLAYGLLEIAQKRMASNYPFHTVFLSKWQIYSSCSIDTIGITLRRGNLILLFNPNFVVACSIDELVGVLHHEVNHLLFGHVFIDPKDFNDQTALVIAQEVTVNEWIPEPLPGKPLLLEQYQELVPNEDTFTRYRKLMASIKQKQNQSRNHKKGNFGVPNLSPSVPKILSSGQNKGQNVQNSKAVQPLDDHSLWQEIRDSGLLGVMTVKVLVKEAASSLSPQQVAKLSPKIKERISAICNDGTNSSFVELQSKESSSVNWRRLLRKYVQQVVETHPVFTKPPRRFPELVGILPAWQHYPSKAVVMAVIDTSGSIDSNTLEAIVKEIEVMAKYHEVTIVECDCIVQAIYKYSGKIQGVTGRGGTDLRPPFSSSIISKIKPQVICYFTDGCGPVTELSPPIPVIWCITENGRKPAEWGREIRLNG